MLCWGCSVHVTDKSYCIQSIRFTGELIEHHRDTSDNLPFACCWFSMPDFPLFFVSNFRHLHFKDVGRNSEWIEENRRISPFYVTCVKVTDPAYSNMASYRASQLISSQAEQTARNLKEQHWVYLVWSYEQRGHTAQHHVVLVRVQQAQFNRHYDNTFLQLVPGVFFVCLLGEDGYFVAQGWRKR